MPGQGSTTRKCVVCHTQLNIACKTCNTCKVEQPHKLRVKNNWRNVIRSGRAGCMMKICWPGRKPNAWGSEVLTPRCHLTETSITCLERLKNLFKAGPHKVLQNKSIKPHQPELNPNGPTWSPGTSGPASYQSSSNWTTSSPYCTTKVPNLTASIPFRTLRTPCNPTATIWEKKPITQMDPQEPPQFLLEKMVWKKAFQLWLQCGQIKGKGQKWKQVEWEPCKLW